MAASKNINVAPIAELLQKNGIKDASKYFHPLESYTSFPNQPTERYVHVVIIQEFNGYAVITQDGDGLLKAKTRSTPNGDKFITRGVEFKRKIVASLRRKSKSLLRTHAPETVKMKEVNGKEIFCDTIQMCRLCPDDSLFGFAVNDGAKENLAFCSKSRVKTDSAFTIQELSSQIAAKIQENGQSSNLRIGDASTSLFDKEHVLPDVTIPVVLTIQDPTMEDIAYMLYLIEKTKRIGASSTRGGTITSHVVGLWLSNEEFISSKFVSQALYEATGCGKELPPVPELVEIAKKVIASKLAGDHIPATFIDGHVAIETVMNKLFATEESTGAWIHQYATLYHEILETLDKKVVKNKEKKGKGKGKEKPDEDSDTDDDEETEDDADADE
jgi:CRISPR-associated protein Csc2